MKVTIHLYFYLLSSKNKEIEGFFINYTKDLRRIDYPKEYPNSIVFVDRDNKVIFNQNETIGYFYIFCDGFWKVFESNFLMSPIEIQEFIRYMVGKHLKLEALTPLPMNEQKEYLVGKHLKL